MVQPITSVGDPAIEAYRSLKDRDVARHGQRFIAESEQVVRRLLASDFPVESVLVAQRRMTEIAPLVPEPIPLYVLPDPLVEQVLGFKFHSGVIACGQRKPALGIDHVALGFGPRATVLICPEIANTENLGALMRIAAGFGVDAMLLGPGSCDPFYRQAIRVSMGTAFRLKLIQSHDLRDDLNRLKRDYGFELAATVLDESAQPLPSARRGPRLGLLFGNEAQGLSREVLALCQRRIIIPMQMGTDSLNVAIAAAVCLYHFTYIEEA